MACGTALAAALRSGEQWSYLAKLLGANKQKIDTLCHRPRRAIGAEERSSTRITANPLWIYTYCATEVSFIQAPLHSRAREAWRLLASRLNATMLKLWYRDNSIKCYLRVSTALEFGCP